MFISYWKLLEQWLRIDLFKYIYREKERKREKEKDKHGLR